MQKIILNKSLMLECTSLCVQYLWRRLTCWNLVSNTYKTQSNFGGGKEHWHRIKVKYWNFGWGCCSLLMATNFVRLCFIFGIYDSLRDNKKYFPYLISSSRIFLLFFSCGNLTCSEAASKKCLWSGNTQVVNDYFEYYICLSSRLYSINI